MENFNIEHLENKGIRGVIVNEGARYSTFELFADAAGYPLAVDRREPGGKIQRYRLSQLSDGDSVKVLAKGRHTFGHTDIYVVEKSDGEQFLIGADGIELTLFFIQSTTLAEATVKELLDELGARFTENANENFIKQAREDVKELTERGRDGDRHDDGEGNLTYREHYYDVEFVVNEEKRTVVALIRHMAFGVQTMDNVEHRGFAKCHPAETFNEDIGKAIALRRALGLNVPGDYLNL